ncbi:hypothetical protein [Mesorhizobium sp. M8A.F.Ca.ET.182.01.1.1]|uniref:hypothetical protein n=1 Tax=unclassified Mesorhizobium TaxID=325217 RepID=UPI00142E990C
MGVEKLLLDIATLPGIGSGIAEGFIVAFDAIPEHVLREPAARAIPDHLAAIEIAEFAFVGTGHPSLAARLIVTAIGFATTA